MADIEDALRTWLESPESSEPGGCYVLSPGSASELLDAIDEARANAAELVAANWRNIAEKDAELRALRDELNRLEGDAATAEGGDQLDEAMDALGFDPDEHDFSWLEIEQRPDFKELIRTFVQNVKSLDEHDPGRASVADEAEIRSLAGSASKSRAWLASPQVIAKLVDGCRLLLQLLDAARQQRLQETTVGPLTEEEVETYKRSTARAEHLLAVKIARQMLSDPNLRHWVEVEMRQQQEGNRSSNPLLKNAQEMFEISVEPARIWVWINGLKTYGEGETWGEARIDALDEIGYALQELWEARETTDEGESDQ